MHARSRSPSPYDNDYNEDCHFQVPVGVKTVPLLLLHGWPGSVREFYEAIPLLTTPTERHDFVFEVIVPSLPGYGFSDVSRPPTRIGRTKLLPPFEILL